MGNRRKQANKRGSNCRAARQRAAVQRRRLLAHRSEVDPLSHFESAYPTVAAAGAAAAAGKVVTVVFGTIADARLSVHVAGGGTSIRCTAFPGMGVRDLLVTAVLNHPDPALAVEGVASALAEHLGTFGDFPGVTVVSEPTGGLVPRFGWQADVDVSALQSWDDFWALHHRGPMGRVCGLAGWEGAAGEVTDRVTDIFRRHGLTVVRCRTCRHPLTNGHPMWPGVWISVDPDVGPVCRPQKYQAGLDCLGEYDRIDIGVAHRPGHENGPAQSFRADRVATLALHS
jgi:hypothetical protein